MLRSVGRIRRWAVFGFEALVRRPRLQQRAIDGEVLTRQVAAQLGLVHDGGEELVRDLVFEEPYAVLGERGRVERGGVDAHVQEPFEQQVVVAPLAERPLRTDRVQRHQHRRLQQRLRWDAAAAPGRVHAIEHVIQLGEHRVDHPADLADRMIRRDQILRRQRRQHRQLRIRAPTHTHSLFDPSAEREHPQRISSTLLVGAPREGWQQGDAAARARV